MLYTCYFALAKNYKDDFDVVSISRFSPSWFKGKEIKEFSPPESLLFGYKNGDIKEDEYNKIYEKEVLSSLSFSKAKDELDIFATEDFLPIWESETNDALLCCYEKQGEFCHRHLLSEKLRSIGIECIEIDKQMLEAKVQSKSKDDDEYKSR